MTDEEVLSSYNDLEMMRRPHLWPGKVLHLKKRDSRGRSPQAFARLSYENGIWILTSVKFGSLKESSALFGTESGDGEFLKKLVEEGWIVD
jgi:hypothetical protein